MPWPQEAHVAELQARFVVEFGRSENRSDVCRRYGISRNTGYKRFARYHRSGVDGLERRSSAPHVHPNAVDDAVVEMVLALRDSTPNSSWGADKIEALWSNMDLGLKSPSRSSITRILKDYRQTQRRRRHLAGPLPGRCPPPAEHANDVWAFDGKGTWRGTDPLTAEDVHSRFLLDIANVPLTTLHVQRRCATLFANHGLPRRIRTDGGLPFAGCGVGRLSSLSLWWLKQGIDLEVVSKPQHNGHLERFHSTLEQEGARDINVDVALEQFRDIYNNIRPHAALGGRTPVEFYLPVPFARAVRPPVVVDDVRKVTSHGAFGWCGHRIFISEVLTSETITFQFLEPSLWLIRYRHLPLALLDEKHMVLRRAFGF